MGRLISNFTATSDVNSENLEVKNILCDHTDIVIGILLTIL